MKGIGRRKNLWPLTLTAMLLFAFVAGIHSASAYSPEQGDSFSYSETTKVNNGQGSYAGYSDQTYTTGKETVQAVSGSVVMSDFSYTYNFSNSQGNSTSGSKSGAFTWSTDNYTYVNGTDNQVGYSNPIYVWFAMNPATPVGGSFSALNTQMVVQSRNYSLQLPTEGRYARTIEAEGSGQYQRNDAYGVFTAAYTWHEYFDPTTGYIVGYNFTEQDTGSYQGQAGSFTYTDILYVSSTSYPLATVAAPVSTTTEASAFAAIPWVWIIIPIVLVMILVIVVLAARGRRQRRPLPEHSVPPSRPQVPPPSPPWQSQVDLGSKPGEQVVIREVAKVNCRYCGTLIPTTVDRCPYCGAPRE